MMYFFYLLILFIFIMYVYHKYIAPPENEAKNKIYKCLLLLLNNKNNIKTYYLYIIWNP